MSSSSERTARWLAGITAVVLTLVAVAKVRASRSKQRKKAALADDLDESTAINVEPEDIVWEEADD